MTRGAQVLLVGGPGGSGKSTLAAAVASQLGWAYLSEDEYWIRNGWGSGLRSVAHERIVQEQVTADLLPLVGAGGGVALELILYELPPNPLTAYRDILNAHGIGHGVVVLTPPVDEILRRMEQRGRPTDLADLPGRRLDAQWQLGVLTPDWVDPAWRLDPTGVAVESLVRSCRDRLGVAP